MKNRHMANLSCWDTLETARGLWDDPLLYTVHRLDCETSGVMVFARTRQAASFLSSAWRDRESVSKIYLGESA